MKFTTLALALSLAFVAACHRDNNRAAAGGSSAAPRNEATVQTPTTPANAGNPSTGEKSEGRNPQQGQVDPKDPAQHRDFKQGGK